MYHDAGTARTLKSDVWELLLSRVGDTVMLHLLLNADMFVTLDNDCCFQLTGSPIIAEARDVKKTSNIVQTKFLHNKGRAEAHPSDCQGIKTQDLVSLGHDGNVSSKGNTKDQKIVKSSKKVRPSSWQRRKLRKIFGEMKSNVSSSEAPAKDGLCEERTLPSRPYAEYLTQHFASDSSTSQNKARSKSAKKFGYCMWPKYILKPADMVIPRTGIFYSSISSPKPGFTGRRTLFSIFCFI